MKNALLIINGVLVIAVGFLLYKQFSGDSNTDSGLHAKDIISAKGKDSMLGKKVLFAYIDMDSIQQNYQLAKNVQKDVEKKKNAINVELERMDKAYKDKVAGYQQKGNTMTEEQANAARQDVESTQAQIMEKRQNLMDEYNSYFANKNMSLKKKIEDYLKIFNADKTFSFIFSYEPGLFYYKDTTYDITSQVLEGLNEQYKNEKNEQTRKEK